MKKSFKIFTAIAAFATATSVIVLGSVVASDPENGFLRRAFAAQDPVVGGTVVFDGANSSTTGSGSSTYSTVLNTTKADNHNILCKVTKNYNKEKATEKLGAVQNGSQIRFYEMDGETEYLFQDITRIEFETDKSSFAFNMTYMYSDGTVTTGTYSSSTKSPRGLNFPEDKDTCYLWIECTSAVSYNVINKITFTYNCVHKTQTDILIKSEPTKTVYSEKEYFDPTGLELSALYSDSSECPIPSYTYTPTRRLTRDDHYITVSQGGVSKDIPITVNPRDEQVIGTYTNSTTTIVLNNDGTGTNANEGYGSVDFTWSYNYQTDKISVVASAISDFVGSLFYESTSSTLSVTYGTTGSISSVKAYVRYGSTSIQRTFNKTA